MKRALARCHVGIAVAWSALGLAATPALAQSCPALEPVGQRSGTWLSGDLHLHSRHSLDSTHNEIAKIIAFAEGAGFGFLAITDHDNHVDGAVADHTWADPEHGSDSLVLLYGAEFTTHRGHANTFSAEPYDHQALWDARDADDAELNPLIETLGIHFSANHPENNDPFSFSYDQVDSIEVWNSVQMTSGVTVWDDLLKSGRRITGRGGSDSHHGAPDQGEESGSNSYERWFNYVGTPTTWVYAGDAGAPDVIAALDSGRVSISANPYGPRVELLADLDRDGVMDAAMGDAVCAHGEPVRFEARLSGGRSEHGRRYRVTVFRNGATWLETRTDPDTGAVVFEDTPPAGERTYYRVEINGRKDAYPGVALSRFIGGDLVAMSNPIYFNYE